DEPDDDEADDDEEADDAEDETDDAEDETDDAEDEADLASAGLEDDEQTAALHHPPHDQRPSSVFRRETLADADVSQRARDSVDDPPRSSTDAPPSDAFARPTVPTLPDAQELSAARADARASAAGDADGDDDGWPDEAD